MFSPANFNVTQDNAYASTELGAATVNPASK